MSCGDPPWPAKSDGDRLLDMLADAIDRQTFKMPSPPLTFPSATDALYENIVDPMGPPPLDLTAGTCPVCKSRVDPEVRFEDTSDWPIGGSRRPLQYVDGYFCSNESCSIVFKRRPGDVWSQSVNDDVERSE